MWLHQKDILRRKKSSVWNKFPNHFVSLNKQTQNIQRGKWDMNLTPQQALSFPNCAKRFKNWKHLAGERFWIYPCNFRNLIKAPTCMDNSSFPKVFISRRHVLRWTIYPFEDMSFFPLIIEGGCGEDTPSSHQRVISK